MKRCLVIGGGLSGLSSAVFLSEKNYDIKLIESSPKLGGRTYSLLNSQTGTYFDNGQHIIMGCYHETLNFLDKLNATKYLEIQKSLAVNFIERGRGIIKLSAPENYYPFNLILGILNYRAISFKARLKIIDFFLDLCFCYTCDLSGITVKEWLLEKKQPKDSIENFWEILTISMLNTKIDLASAEIFAEVLKRVFFDETFSATIILPNTFLGKLFVDSSVKYLDKKNCKIILNETVKKFYIENDEIKKVITDNFSYEDFDTVISAIPSNQLKKILDISGYTKYKLPTFEYSTILNIHIWLKENPFKERFYGFLKSRIHWLFNNGDHISITISAADEYLDFTKEEIVRMICSELEIFFPIFNPNLIIDSKVVKEKRATFIPTIQSVSERKNYHLQIKNLVVAGDWANTNLPSTIEGAILSGKNAADFVAEVF